RYRQAVPDERRTTAKTGRVPAQRGEPPPAVPSKAAGSSGSCDHVDVTELESRPLEGPGQALCCGPFVGLRQRPEVPGLLCDHALHPKVGIVALGPDRGDDRAQRLEPPKALTRGRIEELGGAQAMRHQESAPVWRPGNWAVDAVRKLVRYVPECPSRLAVPEGDAPGGHRHQSARVRGE